MVATWNIIQVYRNVDQSPYFFSRHALLDEAKTKLSKLNKSTLHMTCEQRYEITMAIEDLDGNRYW